MRYPFERLVADLQSLTPAERRLTMGEIGDLLFIRADVNFNRGPYGTVYGRKEFSAERLMDAMDALKMLRGERTTL